MHKRRRVGGRYNAIGGRRRSEKERHTFHSKTNGSKITTTRETFMEKTEYQAKTYENSSTRVRNASQSKLTFCFLIFVLNVLWH